MLTCARVARCHCSPFTAGSLRSPTHSSITTSAICRQVQVARNDEDDLEKPKRHKAAENSAITFETWLNDNGLPFKRARPRNWLGGDVPFPLNPSFRPPTPISDTLKSYIYQQYMENPTLNNVRSLATRYGMSIKRVDAILRLKGLEQHWQKGKTLQTGFAAGMESLLGVDENPKLTVAATLGSDTTGSDLQDQAEGNDRLRDRYIRFFWEPVAEGKKPVMPRVLEHAQLSGRQHTKAVEDAKSDPQILDRREHSLPKIQILPSGSAPGRPTIKFIDVAGKFIDVKEHTRRSKESDRRKKIREKRTKGKSTTRSMVTDKTQHYLEIV